MSLIFAGCIPNNPHCVKETFDPQQSHHSAIVQAIAELEGELYSMKPDTIIVLTEHQVIIPEVINIHVTPSFEHELFFGIAIKTDVLFSSELKGTPEAQQHLIPITIVAEPLLEERVAAPLALLFRHLNTRAKTVVLSIPQLPKEALVNFGELLKKEIMRSDSRIALIATGHLGIHEGTTEASAQSFDHLIETYCAEKQYVQILSINPQIIEAARTDLYAALTVFLSCIKDIHVTPQVLASEIQDAEKEMVLNCVL